MYLCGVLFPLLAIAQLFSSAHELAIVPSYATLSPKEQADLRNFTLVPLPSYCHQEKTFFTSLGTIYVVSSPHVTRGQPTLYTKIPHDLPNPQSLVCTNDTTLLALLDASGVVQIYRTQDTTENTTSARITQEMIKPSVHHTSQTYEPIQRIHGGVGSIGTDRNDLIMCFHDGSLHRISDRKGTRELDEHELPEKITQQTNAQLLLPHPERTNAWITASFTPERRQLLQRGNILSQEGHFKIFSTTTGIIQLISAKANFIVKQPYEDPDFQARYWNTQAWKTDLARPQLLSATATTDRAILFQACKSLSIYRTAHEAAFESMPPQNFTFLSECAAVAKDRPQAPLEISREQDIIYRSLPLLLKDTVQKRIRFERSKSLTFAQSKESFTLLGISRAPSKLLMPIEDAPKQEEIAPKMAVRSTSSRCMALLTACLSPCLRCCPTASQYRVAPTKMQSVL